MNQKLKDAAAALKKKDFNRVYEITDSVLMFNAMNYKALLLYGQSLVGLERLPEAIDAFERAIESADQPFMAYYALSQVYKEMRNYKKQLELLSKFLDTEQHYQAAVEAIKCCQRLLKYTIGEAIAKKVIKEYKLSKSQEKNIYNMLYYIQKDNGAVEEGVYLKLLTFDVPIHEEYFKLILKSFHTYTTDKDKNHHMAILRKITKEKKLQIGIDFFAQFQSDLFDFDPLTTSPEQLITICKQFKHSTLEKHKELFENPDDFDRMMACVSDLEQSFPNVSHLYQLMFACIFYTFEQYESLKNCLPLLFNSLADFQDRYMANLDKFLQFFIQLVVGTCLYAPIDHSLYSYVNTYHSLVGKDLFLICKFKLAVEAKKIEECDALVKDLDYLMTSGRVSEPLEHLLLVLLAKYYIFINDLAKAKSLLPVPEIDENASEEDIEIALLYVKCCIANNEKDSKIFDLLTAIIKYNDYSDAFSYLGDYFKSTDPNKSVKCWLKALSIEFNEHASNSLLSHINELVLSNLYDESIIASHQCIKLALQHFEINKSESSLLLLIYFYFRLSKYAECISYCHSYNKTFRKNVKVTEYIASSYFQLGNYASAAESYESLNIENNEYFLFQLCICYHYSQTYDVALPLLPLLSKNYPDLYFFIYQGYIQNLLQNSFISKAVSTAQEVLTRYIEELESKNENKPTFPVDAFLMPIMSYSELFDTSNLYTLIDRYSHPIFDEFVLFYLEKPTNSILLLLASLTTATSNLVMVINHLLSIAIPSSLVLNKVTSFVISLKSSNEVQLGLFYMLTQNRPLAQHYLIACIKKDPQQSAIAWYYLGMLYDNELSLECFNNARDQSPHHINYWQSIVDTRCKDKLPSNLMKGISICSYLLNKQFHPLLLKQLLSLLVQCPLEVISAMDIDSIQFKCRQYQSFFPPEPSIEQFTNFLQAIQIKKSMVIQNKPYLDSYYKSGNVVYLCKHVFQNPTEHLVDWIEAYNEMNYKKDPLVSLSVINKSIQRLDVYKSRTMNLYHFMHPNLIMKSNDKYTLLSKCPNDTSKQIQHLLTIIQEGNGYWRIYLKLYQLLIKNGYKMTSYHLVQHLPMIWQVWHHIFIDQNNLKVEKLLTDLSMAEKDILKLYIEQSTIKSFKNKDYSVLLAISEFIRLVDDNKDAAIDCLQSAPKHHRISMILDQIND